MASPPGKRSPYLLLKTHLQASSYDIHRIPINRAGETAFIVGPFRAITRSLGTGIPIVMLPLLCLYIAQSIPEVLPSSSA